MKRSVKYVGEDSEFVEKLKQNSEAWVWEWTEFKAYTDLASYLRCVKQCQTPNMLTSGKEFRLWLRNRFAPVVLDIDFKQPGTAEIVRNIKQIDGGVPIIVISQQPSLTSYSLARMDGAEALYAKSLNRPESLIEGIQAAFEKIDRWEKMLLQFRRTPRVAGHGD